MKHQSLFTIIVSFLALPFVLHGQDWQTFQFENVNRDIPDGSLSGTSDTQTVSANGNAIQAIQVGVDIVGGPAFNGDLYAYLVHDDGFAVLLNRSGRTTGDLAGYPDSGFNVTFSDSAPNGDVHDYRLTLYGNEATPIDPTFQSPLTGLWAPDGRNVTPGIAYGTTPRTAMLSSFTGLDPNGNWTLFLADTSSGGTATLQSWSISVKSVPEPTTGSLVLLGMGFFLLRAFRR